MRLATTWYSTLTTHSDPGQDLVFKFDQNLNIGGLNPILDVQ